MDKQRKKFLIVFAVFILIAITLMAVLFVKKPDKVTVPSSETEVQEPLEPEEEEPSNENDESAFVTDEEKPAYFMDGNKEKPEEKKTDYTYLLTAEPVPFKPKMPDYWADREMQVDKIPDFFEKKPEERAVYFEEKMDFSEKEAIEIEKLKKINNTMYTAYHNGDYNDFLKHMYKGWREYYGVFIGKIIVSKEYSERILGFYPEIIDTDIGYASGFLVKEVSFYYNGEVSERRIIDVFIMYKQNSAGEWEVYYEYQLD